MQIIPRNSFLRTGLDLFDDPSRGMDAMKADLYEKDSMYYLEVDLPGFSKEDIQLDYNNGYLTVRASKEGKSEDIKNYTRKERFFGQYERSFYVGNIEETDIKANYKEGVLVVTFPKETEKDRRKSINIE